MKRFCHLQFVNVFVCYAWLWTFCSGVQVWAIVGPLATEETVGETAMTSPASRSGDSPQEDSRSLIKSITKETLRRNRDGEGITWFHPRPCMIPTEDGEMTALMTLQEISGSDYFGSVHWSESRDLGRTWTEPVEIPALAREPVAGHAGLQAGVCDVTPQYHPQTGTVLALGHVVFYRGLQFARGDQLARYPVYAVRRKDGTWSERKILRLPYPAPCRRANS